MDGCNGALQMLDARVMPEFNKERRLAVYRPESNESVAAMQGCTRSVQSEERQSDRQQQSDDGQQPPGKRGRNQRRSDARAVRQRGVYVSKTPTTYRKEGGGVVMGNRRTCLVDSCLTALNFDTASGLRVVRD